MSAAARTGRRLAGAVAVLGLLCVTGSVLATPGWFRDAGSGVADELSDAVLGDLDGDGDLDAYLVRDVSDSSSGAQNALADRILENRSGVLVDLGAGSGADAAAPTAGVEAEIADVDGDGDRDLIVAGASVYSGPGGMNVASPTRIYRNTGNGALGPGRFTPGQSLSGFALRLAVADWDGDGDPDIALALDNGSVEAWVNQGGAQAGTPGNFALAQTIAGQPFTPVNAIAIGDLSGDARLDLALENTSVRGVRVITGSTGALPFAGVQFLLGITYPIAQQQLAQQVRDLAIGQLDGSGRADLLVVTTAGATVFFAGPVSGFSESREEFPFEQLESGLIADLNDDGRNDLVLGSASANGGGLRYIGNLGSDNFRASAQCPDTSAVVVSLAAGDVDGDQLPDLLVNGLGASVDLIGPGRAPGATLLRNDAAFGLDACCAAEIATFDAFLALGKSASMQVFEAGKSIARTAIDLAALRELRAESMSVSADGQRMTARYDQFSAEVVALLQNNDALGRQARDTLGLWRSHIVELNRWRGDTVFVSQAQVTAMDQFLAALSGAGTPALAQMIAEERALQPPFQDFVGMSMSEFREVTLDFPILFRDGLE